MNQSRRARRMERHHKLRKTPALNLVSLMDIFTILVFFLLVSSSTSQQLPSGKDLKLPTSVAKTVPKETVIIALTKTEILVQGQRIISIDDALALETEAIQPLVDELRYLSTKKITQEAADGGQAVTVMGDENTDYDVIQKVLTSCQQANYTKIAFAADQTAKKSS